jgi:hypothetical protein
MEPDGGGGGASFAITGRNPNPGSSGVPVTAYVEVTFSALIDTGSVDADAILLNGEAFGSVIVNGSKLRFVPAAPLTSGTSYSISLAPDLQGKNGHPLGASPTWGFKTAGPTPPPDSLPPLGPRPR